MLEKFSYIFNDTSGFKSDNNRKRYFGSTNNLILSETIFSYSSFIIKLLECILATEISSSILKCNDLLEKYIWQSICISKFKKLNDEVQLMILNCLYEMMNFIPSFCEKYIFQIMKLVTNNKAHHSSLLITKFKFMSLLVIYSQENEFIKKKMKKLFKNEIVKQIFTLNNFFELSNTQLSLVLILLKNFIHFQ